MSLMTEKAVRRRKSGGIIMMVFGAMVCMGSAKPSVEPHRIEKKPGIDGVLNEAVWEQATRITDFGQVEPREGEAPTERTEVRIMRTNEALYLGVTCFDRTPAGVLARDRRRDSTGSGDDRLRIVIDPFARGTEGYFFGIAAGGGLGDGVVRSGSRPEMEWDCIWNAKTRVTADGWVAEVEIPFRSISFQPDQESWGFNVERVIRRKEEKLRWASATRKKSLYALEGAGRITEMKDLKTGLGLDVRPTTVARWRQEADGSSIFEIEPSMDLFYRITPSLTATWTWQTDFANAEVDARVVNTTRFPLFFPEKRSFFLEDARYFRFGRVRRSPLPFHSRTIGLSADGERVPIEMGTKLTGKIGKWNIGAMGVGLDGQGALAGDEVFAGRVTYDLFEESQVGAIVTDGDPRGNGSARTYGLDFHLKDSRFRGQKAETAELIGWLMQTENEGVEDYGWGLTAGYPNNPLYMRVGLQRVGVDLDPAMGFVRRPGIYEFTSFFSYEIEPKGKLWNEIDFDFSAGFDADLDWAILSEEYEFDVAFERRGGGEFSIGILHERERFLEDFEISDGVTVPVGDYRSTRVFAGIETPSSWKWGGELSVSAGESLGGQRQEVDLRLFWKPSADWAARITAANAWHQLPGGNFDTLVVNSSLQWTPTTNLLLTGNLQYDNVSEEIGINARVRWTVKPGSDVYFVVNQSLAKVGPERRYENAGREAVAKMGWTWRF
ncbi:MAG: hypothetical protein ACI8UZ_000889 [Akkermansiaceae bacterium]|jgi:hypothetical protein